MKNLYTLSFKRTAQQGFTLIEVLVALVIFAFGLLAAAGLQISSLQSSRYSANSVTATSMAREYGELLQMIPAEVSSVATTTSTSSSTLTINTSNIASNVTANDCVGTTKSCTPAQLIAAMKNDWALRVKSSQALPQGRAEACRDSTPRNAGELEWGGCDAVGEMILVKMGWHGKPVAGNKEVSPDWMTVDRPRFAISIMGNLKDYVSP